MPELVGLAGWDGFAWLPEGESDLGVEIVLTSVDL